MDAILQMSAADLARKIRAKELTPVEVVEAHIQRIEAVNPRLNAVITPLFQTARVEAAKAQAHIETHGTENLPPLFGVPMTVKDCWPVKDVRFTGGSWYMRDNIATTDAEAVRLLREAGAIILGKTNLPDMCWSAESKNLIFGRTNNPHDPDTSAGGSSGGEGSIIAAGGSPLGLGSDIAGSVRLPAAMNGCVSLKPTGGRIPAEDHNPKPPPEIYDWNTAGPLARRIEDLALALQVLSRTPVLDYTKINLADRPCKVYMAPAQMIIHDPQIVETIDQAMNALKHAGMNTTRDENLPLIKALYLFAGIFRKYGDPEFRKALGGGKNYTLWKEALRNLIGRGRISPHVLFFTFAFEFIGKEASSQGLDTFEILAQVRQEVLDGTGEGGIILLPVQVTPPPPHGWVWRARRYPAYTFIFNALEFPVVVVPIRYNEKGLPLAVQIVARPGEDEVALAAAAHLERLFGGWKPAEL